MITAWCWNLVDQSWWHQNKIQMCLEILYQWPERRCGCPKKLHITICRTNDSALVSLRRTSDKTLRYLGSKLKVTPTFTFAGVYLRVTGDQVIRPVEVIVMSPHQGNVTSNVTSLITLSPPPLCSQFPIIHLIRRCRQQGDTSHWGSCITILTKTHNRRTFHR